MNTNDSAQVQRNVKQRYLNLNFLMGKSVAKMRKIKARKAKALAKAKKQKNINTISAKNYQKKINIALSLGVASLTRKKERS